jgi:hypothetical protein
MEVEESSPGKYRVLLNGTVVSCAYDVSRLASLTWLHTDDLRSQTDCPSAALCATNEAWIDTSATSNGGMCACNTRFGFTGLNCKGYCPARTASLWMHIAIIFIGFFIFLYALYLFRQAWKNGILVKHQSAHFRKVRWCAYWPTAVGLIMSTAILGIFFMTLGTLSNLFLSVDWDKTYHIIPVAIPQPTTSPVGKLTNPVMLDVSAFNPAVQGLKRVPQSLEVANGAINGLAYGFSTACVVMLPLTWVSTRLLDALFELTN